MLLVRGVRGGDEAAVDDEVGAGHVGRAITREEQDEVRDLLRAGESSGDALRGGPGLNVVRAGPLRLCATVAATPSVAEPEVGLDGPGTDRVDAEPRWAELLRQRLAQVGQRTLGGAVVDDQGIGQERVDRADGHDGGLVAFSRVGEGGAHRAHRREEVDREGVRPVVVGDGQVAVGSRPHPAHVVDEDVDVVVLLDRLGDEGCRAGVGAEIDAHRVHVPALGQQVELGTSVAGGRDDERAFFGERPADGQPDPLARPGDDRHLARQVELHERRR